MRQLYALVCASFIFSAAQSQNSITGLVTDQQKKPLKAITVSLLKSADSTLIKTELTDDNGQYELVTKVVGNYLLSFSGTGFAKKYSAPFVIESGKKITVPAIELVQAVTNLKEVTITSTRKPMIEVKADKTVFNVENSINATGSNAMELLQKSPGIMVDNNDNISMKGKTGVRIYIDGKPTQLDSKSLADYLKSINSNDIEAIEMISNPSAKYDASGNAGVINIRLKKNKKYGSNGNVSAGFVQGVTPKGNASVALNYRDKKISLFSNISGNIGDYQNTMFLKRTQNDTFFNMNSTHISRNENVNVKAGADLYMSKYSTIGLIGTANLSNNDFYSTSQTPIYSVNNGGQTYVKTLIAGNAIPGSRTNTNVNFNYRFADTSGNEISFDADYGLFRGKGNSRQPNIYYNNSNVAIDSFIYRNSTPTDIDIYTAKADAEHRLKKGKIGYGIKFSYVKTSNTFDFFKEDAVGTPVKMLERSNSFTYKENVNAAYINYQQPLSKKWSMQIGLRAEQTNSRGELTRADGRTQAEDTVDRHYLNLFPSAAFTFNASSKHTFNLTYSRRIDRPSYQDLNPFENKLDELTYQKGNAFLRPQYTDNVELTHTFMGFLNTTVGYSYVKDYATEVTDTTNKNATFVQQQNLATQQIISFNIGSPLPIKKWWNGYANFWYNYQMFNGQINANKVTVNIPMYGAYMQHTFTLGKDYTSEISGWYNGPSIWGATWRTKPQGGIDIGVQKLLLEKKASVKLSVTDILFTAPWKANNNFGGMSINGGGTWESRTLRLNFTYRFGNSQVKGARQRNTGNESEAKRIK